MPTTRCLQAPIIACNRDQIFRLRIFIPSRQIAIILGIKTEYVTLSYYPQSYSDEHIHVGFFLHDVENGELYFRFVKRIGRVMEFDDRLDEGMVTSLLDYAKATLKTRFDEAKSISLFGGRKEEAFVRKAGYFDFLRRNFQNQLRLSDTVEADAKSSKEFFEEMRKIVLYFDLDHKSRPSESQGGGGL